MVGPGAQPPAVLVLPDHEGGRVARAGEDHAAQRRDAAIPGRIRQCQDLFEVQAPRGVRLVRGADVNLEVDLEVRADVVAVCVDDKRRPRSAVRGGPWALAVRVDDKRRRAQQNGGDACLVVTWTATSSAPNLKSTTNFTSVPAWESAESAGLREVMQQCGPNFVLMVVPMYKGPCTWARP